MTIRFVATDLDDTLLDTSIRVPAAAKETIRRMQEAGVIVAIATGRMHQSAEYVAAEAGITAPIVSFNGAMIRQIGATKPIYHLTLSKEQVALFWSLGIDKNLAVHFYINDILYLRSLHPLSVRYVQDTKCPYQVFPEMERAVTEIGLPSKILIAGEESLLQDIWRRAAPYQKDLYVTSSFPCFLEFLNPAADKGSGVRKLGELLGIPQDQTLVIGDNLNDRELFEGGDVKIAMGNAVQPLKEMATWVTDTNDRNGWVKAMERFVLIK